MADYNGHDQVHKPHALPTAAVLFIGTRHVRSGSLTLGGLLMVMADLLPNLAYDIPPEVVGRFRRSALLDIDPGLTQLWMSKGLMNVARHDAYFTIGETVAQPSGARFPDVGLKWEYTPLCVALDWWPPCRVRGEKPRLQLWHTGTAI